MERAMLGVSLRDQIRNEKNKNYRHSSASRKAKVQMGGAHSSENRWTLGAKVLDWRPRTGKRSVGRPRSVGSRWKQAAQDRGFWNSLQKTYVQQWTAIG
ncbi:jg8893 [Pararge aegeria aegeria]|uniref:Jg8893 protein n=1 Tax=Pararge aegeria aegeria TaxID=348720 RepID=A0A8S4QJU6_9NEOP|nr:jg8893 [Pararge aegeria aegeria]